MHLLSSPTVVVSRSVGGVGGDHNDDMSRPGINGMAQRHRVTSEREWEGMATCRIQ